TACAASDTNSGTEVRCCYLMPTPCDYDSGVGRCFRSSPCSRRRPARDLGLSGQHTARLDPGATEKGPGQGASSVSGAVYRPGREPIPCKPQWPCLISDVRTRSPMMVILVWSAVKIVVVWAPAPAIVAWARPAFSWCWVIWAIETVSLWLEKAVIAWPLAVKTLCSPATWVKAALPPWTVVVPEPVTVCPLP